MIVKASSNAENQFTASPSIMTEIKDNIIPNGYKYGPIQWNGKSDSGAKLKPGVYIFSLFASLKNGEISNNSGRLILIN